MYKPVISVLLLFAVSSFVSAAQQPPETKQDTTKQCCAEETTQKTEINNLDDIMTQLKKTTDSIKSYQAKINYLYIQDPELLDSRTYRKGELFYSKIEGKSNLRINFNTIKQDEAKEQMRIEQYSFDGVWLIRIDHQLKKADYHQQAMQDKPLDVFDFINRNFPLIGFTKTDQLSKDFDIKWINSENRSDDKFYHLHLDVKKDSKYKKEFISIDFYIDSQKFLPARIVTKSTEEDIYDISFIQPVTNKAIPVDAFKIDIPKDFEKNIHPIKQQNSK